MLPTGPTLTPWLVAGIFLAAIAGAGVGYYAGIDHAQARDAREEQLLQQAVATASQEAGRAIAQIRVNHTTIKQELEREIHKQTVYLGCQHSPDGLRLVNEALSGAVRPGAGQLPPPDAPAR